MIVKTDEKVRIKSRFTEQNEVCQLSELNEIVNVVMDRFSLI